MTAYDVGDQVKLTATFTNASAVAADPTAVTVKTKTPAGVTTTYTYGVDNEVVKSATGIYYILLTLATAGLWYVRFAGTGAIVAAAETSIDVMESNF